VLAHLGYKGSPALAELVARYPAVVSVEEGYTAGGLGALVAQTIASGSLPCRLSVRGVDAPFDGRSGRASYMRELNGLGPAALAEDARRLLAETTNG
jgi:transketolase C-terminal domain/subunit